MGLEPIIGLMGMLVLLAAPSNDLLDYLPTQPYWASKHVEISVQTMAAELQDASSADMAGLIDQLSNPDPQIRNDARKKLAQLGRAAIGPLRDAVNAGDPQTVSAAKELVAQIIAQSQPSAVRRLMAIRALGESGDPAALAVLTPLLKSSDLFEADYAAAAIAELNHEPYARPPAAAADCAADAWRLPGDCAVVLQATNYRFHHVSLAALMTQEMVTTNRTRQEVEDEYNGRVLAIAEVLGNVRLQGLTIGLSGQVGMNSGYAVLVFRGEFDPLALNRAIETQIPGMHDTTVAGCRVYADQDVTFMVPDAHRVVLMIDAQGTAIDPVVAAVGAGKDDLHGSADLAPLLKGADMTAPVWGVAKITPSYSALSPMLAPFDTLSLTSGIEQDQMLHVKLTATGNDPAGARASVGAFNTGVADTLRDMRQGLLVWPMAGPLLKTLETVHCDADGGTAKMTMQMPPSLVQAILDTGSPSAENPPGTPTTGP